MKPDTQAKSKVNPNAGGVGGGPILSHNTSNRGSYRGSQIRRGGVSAGPGRNSILSKNKTTDFNVHEGRGGGRGRGNRRSFKAGGGGRGGHDGHHTLNYELGQSNSHNSMDNFEGGPQLKSTIQDPDASHEDAALLGPTADLHKKCPFAVMSESGEESVSDELKSKKHLFTSEEDLLLLRELYCSRPFLGSYKEVPQNWIVSVSNMGWTFEVKAVRRRFEKLMDKFKSDQRASLLSSGTEEDFDEKIQLLGDIQSLLESAAVEKDKSTAKAKQDELNRSKAEEVRNAALTGMMKSKGTKPGVKGANNDEVIDIFKKKAEDDKKFRNDELEFKKMKFNTLTTERKEDRKLELRRIKLQERSQSQQTKLMMELIRQLKK